MAWILETTRLTLLTSKKCFPQYQLHWGLGERDGSKGIAEYKRLVKFSCLYQCT